jgi:type I restriction enzyme S subunit
MERYSEYKDSGVQWLGEIPRHWKTVRVKALLSERVDKSDTGLEEPLSMSQKYGIIPTREMDVVPNMASTYIGAKRVFKQDLVFNKLKAHLGVFAISKYDGLVSPDYAVYTPNERTYLPFMEYVFHTPLYIGEFTRKATGVAIGLTRLYTNGLFAVPFLYPPLSEQHSIVSYLDDKCGKIDKMLEGKQKQIELLAEMKQRIIADAVTRGINPDVKMKATNIPWLPEIPEHWEFTRNKTLLKLTDEKVGGRKDITLLSLTKQGVIIRDLSEGKGKFPKDFDSYLVVRPNNLVFCLFDIDETPRTVGLVRNYGMLTGAYTNFEVNESLVLPEYIYNYYLQVDNIKGLRPYYTGLRKVVKTGSFLQIRMPLPPLDEQRAIVSYITDKTSKIDTLTSKLQQEIESIKEYKQRLISDVVTGQIKVC